MRKFLFITQFIFLSNSIFCQTEKSQKNYICETKTSVFFGDDKNAKTIFVESLDKNGNKLQSLTFSDIKLHSKFEYKYDINNNKTLTIENGNKDLKQEYHYKYNSDNKIAEKWNSDFLDIYYYNSKNQIYKMVHTNKETKEIKEILYKYDDNGNKIAEYVEGNQFYINQYCKYNTDNLIIEEENFYHNESKDKLYSKFLYLYDNNKKLIYKKFVDGYSTQNDISYTYDKNGNLKSEEVNGQFLTTYYYSETNVLYKKEKFVLSIKMKTTEFYEYKFCE